MKKIFSPYNILISLLLTLCANCYIAVSAHLGLLYIAVPLFIAINAFPAPKRRDVPGFRMRVCGHGLYMLRAFLPAACVSVVYHAVLLIASIGAPLWHVLWSALIL